MTQSPLLVSISGGSFIMGEHYGKDDEKPVHPVSLDSFFIGKYPVTTAEFFKFLSSTRYDFPQQLLKDLEPTHPVTNVSWMDALAYCGWLSEVIGAAYRLPTEAEWEYVARSGSSENIYPWGDRDWMQLAELHTRFQTGPEPVGTLLASNRFGVCDMGLNVHEWCMDWYDANYYRDSPTHNPRGSEYGDRRSSRGGSWRHQIKITRCAARSSIPPEYRYGDYGFRVLREIN